MGLEPDKYYALIATKYKDIQINVCVGVPNVTQIQRPLELEGYSTVRLDTTEAMYNAFLARRPLGITFAKNDKGVRKGTLHIL